MIVNFDNAFQRQTKLEIFQISYYTNLVKPQFLFVITATAFLSNVKLWRYSVTSLLSLSKFYPFLNQSHFLTFADIYYFLYITATYSFTIIHKSYSSSTVKKILKNYNGLTKSNTNKNKLTKCTPSRFQYPRD